MSRPVGITEATAKVWADWYEAGATLYEIAAEAGVSPMTVLRHLREQGVQMRGPGPRTAHVWLRRAGA